MKQALENRYYYLANFELVLAWVRERYNDLLAPAERDFLAQFPALKQESRALLVRMVMRKGVLFRGGKLRYDEIGDCAAAAEPLVKHGWVDDKPLLSLDQVFGLLSQAELSSAFVGDIAQRRTTKAEQFAALASRYTESRVLNAWYGISTEAVYHLLIMPLCDRLRLMFFGNLRQDWCELVLADLGLHTYEPVGFPVSSRAFHTRSDVDSYMHLHACREQLDAGISAALVLKSIPRHKHENPWIERRRSKLLYQIGRSAERERDWAGALDIYSHCTHPQARSRTIRVLERSMQFTAALQLAGIALRNPGSDAEKQQLARIMPRLSRHLGQTPTAAIPAATIPKLVLPLPQPQAPYTVEELVGRHFSRIDSPVYYVENALINSLFGLLCWDAIFAPLPGAFFHPFQSGPADLGSADFHQRREVYFSACLDQLESGRYRQTIMANYDLKNGIESIFVAWHVISDELLGHALACIPALHLRRWFERILLDARSNRSGLPDLIQFWPTENRYRMIEVKAPGDRLQDNQLRWLGYCIKHDIPVAVCHVQWAVPTP